ncbi:hypothetical protein [Paenibacillus sp. GCM10012303]|uniref:hypothetical protein n=1 Tax=Paenibacillus sp. GCM10012303 TaxID=3317340 RepID=UPI003622C67A
MKKLVDLLRQKMALIVSVPSNSLSMIQAAVEGGADAIKIHFNVEHRASGTMFGKPEQYAGLAEEIARIFPGPIGCVPGDSPEKVTKETIDRLVGYGFDFVSLYAHHAPAWICTERRISMMAAVSGDYTEREAASFWTLPIDVLEASIVPGTEYGTPLTVRDLLAYRGLVEASGKPVVVPSQRRITPDDLEALQLTGVRGVMIGAIVTGTEASSIYETTKRFRRAMDALNGNG